LAGAAARLPAAERLRPRPRAGGRPGAAVDVQHAGLGLVEEALDLGLLGAEDAGGEAVVGGVGLGERLREIGAARDGEEGQEQLLAREPMPEREVVDDGRLDEPALRAGLAAPDRKPSVALRLAHARAEAVVGTGV